MCCTSGSMCNEPHINEIKEALQECKALFFISVPLRDSTRNLFTPIETKAFLLKTTCRTQIAIVSVYDLQVIKF